MKSKDFILVLLLVVTLLLISTVSEYSLIRSTLKPQINNIQSGIYGKAILGPTCPVQKEGEVCSQPYQGVIVVKNSDRTKEITQFMTNADGTFRVVLPPGQYYLSQDPKTRFPKFLKEQLIAVEPDKFTEVNLSLDTGIR